MADYRKKKILEMAQMRGKDVASAADALSAPGAAQFKGGGYQEPPAININPGRTLGEDVTSALDGKPKVGRRVRAARKKLKTRLDQLRNKVRSVL